MRASVFGFRHEASARARRNSRLYQLGQFITQAGDQLFGFGLALESYARTGSAASVGFVFASTQLGSLLGYFLIPYLRPDRPKLALVGTDLASAGLVASILLLPPDARYGALFLIGALRAINKPFHQAIVPALVDRAEQVKEMNASAQMIFQLATALGLFFAAVWGTPSAVGWLVALNAASFLASAAMEAAYRLDSSRLAPRRSGSTPLAQLGRLGATLRASREISIALVPGSLIFALILGINTQFVPIFHAIRPGRGTYVLAEALVVIGILGSSYAIKRGWTSAWEKRVGASRSWLAGWALTGACYLAMGALPSLGLALALILVSAFGDGLGAVLQTTTLHEASPESELSEIFGARILLRNLSRAGITALMGLTADWAGSLPMLAGSGALILALALASRLWASSRGGAAPALASALQSP